MPRPCGAVLDGLVHGQPLRGRLLARDHDIDVVAAAQAVIGHRKQAVGVRRQVDANDLGLLVDDVVDEPRILMAEPVVVLPPHVRTEEVVERSDRPTPRDVVARLQPLGVLVEHRIDDVNERLVAREEAVPARQQIGLQPALALMLAEHFHHAAVGAELVVFRIDFGHVAARGHVQHILPAIRVVLVRAEQAEVLAVQVQLHDVAQEPAHFPRRFGGGCARARHLDGVVAEVRHLEIAQQQAAVGVRIVAHAAMTRRAPVRQFRS